MIASLHDRPDAELLGEHARGGELVDHAGDVDKRVIAVARGELGLIGRLEPVVELLGDALAQLTRRAAHVEAQRARGYASEQAQECRQQLGVLQVGANCVRDPRILDLHGHPPPVAQPRGVHLADRCRRERLPIELCKRAQGPGPELALEQHLRQLAGHRRRVVAQTRERGLVGRLELCRNERADRHDREHLTRLHQRALGAAEQLGVALGRTRVKLGAVGARELATQPGHDRLAGGASRKPDERSAAAHAPAADTVTRPSLISGHAPRPFLGLR